MLQQFIAELNWPDEVLASHLMKRLKLMASDMVQSCVKRYTAFVMNHRITTNTNTVKKRFKQKHWLLAKRGKSCARCQTRENMHPRPSTGKHVPDPSAGKHARASQHFELIYTKLSMYATFDQQSTENTSNKHFRYFSLQNEGVV